jgi:hypothetical protein
VRTGDPGTTTRDDLVHLLPIYDEYLVSYRDREAVPHGSSIAPSGRKPVIFQHALVIAGQVAGTWRTAQESGGGLIHAHPMRTLTRHEQRAMPAAVERYARFRGVPLRLSSPSGPARPATGRRRSKR